MNEAPAGFVITKEYRRFGEFCDACRRYRYIGLCHGPPGVGKTISARHYSRWDELKPYILREPRAEEPAEINTCHTIFFTPTVAITPGGIIAGITKLVQALHCRTRYLIEGSNLCNAPGDPHEPMELLIVDEADRLRLQGLETVRDFYDRGHFGLILVGMPGIEKRLSRYPQLYSRVGFVHAYRPLSAEETAFVLSHHWQHLGMPFTLDDFTDTEAMAAIVRITGGNFRLIQRLFTQIDRILQINQMHTITKEVVEAAREGLVIGSV